MTLANEKESPKAQPSDGGNRLKWAALCALLLGYSVLSHYGSSPDAKGLGAALSVGPILLLAVVLLWRWLGSLPALLLGVVGGAVAFRYWTVIENDFEWADLVQQCGIYGLVAAGFARSLMAGRVPLCTQLSMTLHGELTPREVAYTRIATGAWAGFYGVLTAAILGLFFTASLHVWSLFVNFATFGLIVLMGLADHALRRRVLPRHPAGSILGIIRRSLTG